LTKLFDYDKLQLSKEKAFGRSFGRVFRPDPQ